MGRRQATTFVMHGGWGDGFQCPECGRSHNSVGRDHWILGHILDRKDRITGLRVYCMACEHIWTDDDMTTITVETS